MITGKLSQCHAGKGSMRVFGSMFNQGLGDRLALHAMDFLSASSFVSTDCMRATKALSPR
jgi:hypothetical protein